jgi:hypothetical protein
MDKELLKQLKEYIEDSEYKINQEWGYHFDLTKRQLINRGLMPDIYYKIVKLIYLNNK